MSNKGIDYVFYEDISIHFNLIPFRTIVGYINNANTIDEAVLAISNVIGNLCLFIPIGFLFPFASKKVSLKRFIIFVLSLILVIEAVQFYVGRSADIDDVILNLSGALCGYLGYCIVKRISERFCRK